MDLITLWGSLFCTEWLSFSLILLFTCSSCLLYSFSRSGLDLVLLADGGVKQVEDLNDLQPW